MRSASVPDEISGTAPVSGVNSSSNGVHWLAVPTWMGSGGDHAKSKNSGPGNHRDWLWHGFSTRRGGVSGAYLSPNRDQDLPDELNLGFTAADLRENVLENRLRFVEAVTGSRETPLATVRQIHSNFSVVVGEDWVSGPGASVANIPEADGIMTNRRGLLLGIQTADCIPVLVADPVTRSVAAFHAGWRGTVSRVVERGVAQMREVFGSDPSVLIAAIGPGIGHCCYAVGTEVQAQFKAGFSYATELFAQDGKLLCLDLKEANRLQLMAAGVPAGSISLVGGCTSCRQDLFFSHRASGGHAGRMMAVIGVA